MERGGRNSFRILKLASLVAAAAALLPFWSHADTAKTPEQVAEMIAKWKKDHPNADFPIVLENADRAAVVRQMGDCRKKSGASLEGCYEQAELKNEEAAAKAFDNAKSRMHPDALAAVAQQCLSGQYATVLESRACAVSTIDELAGYTERWSNPRNLARENFNRFISDQQNENAWFLPVYQERCLDTDAADPYACFLGLMKRMTSELRSAEKSADDSFVQVLKNHALMYDCNEQSRKRSVHSTPDPKCVDTTPWTKPLVEAAQRHVDYVPRGSSGSQGGTGAGRTGKGKNARTAAGSSTGNTDADGGTGGAGNGTGNGVGNGSASGRHAGGGAGNGGGNENASAAGGTLQLHASGSPGGKGKGNPNVPMDPDGAACENGDCRGAIQLDITDHSGIPGEGLYQCPAFLQGFNCLQLGDGKEGDLLTKTHDAALREQYCRDKLDQWVTQGYVRDVAGAALLGLAATGNGADTQEAREHAMSVLAQKDPAGSGRACEVYFKEVVGYKDPLTGQPAVPRLETPHDIDLAKVSSNPALHDLLMYTADALTRDVEHDIGAFSVQQQAKFIFTSDVLQDPALLSDDVRYKKDLAEFFGDGSATQCLGKDDRKKLQLDLTAERASLKDGMEAARKADPVSNPTRSWAAEMTKAADRDHQLEKGEYVLGMLSARLYCQRNAVVMGRDFTVDLHEDWKYGDRQSDVDEATYQARLAWFQSKYHELTGDNTGVTDDGKVNCRRLSEMRHEIERQREDNLSSHPLLTDVRPIPSTGDEAKDLAAQLEGQTFEVKCAAGAVPGYGPVDPAGGFEAQRAAHPILNGCSRKKTLSDRLVAEPLEAKRIALLKETAARKRQDALKRLKEVCGPGKNDLAKEGKRASHVDGIVTDYLACRDVGTGSGTCDQRRSEGWVLCRSYAQKYDDDRLQELKDFYKQMGMMVVTTAAMMVPGGGVAMRLVNLGLIGGGFAMEYREKVKAEQQLQISSVDFNNQKISYAQYKQALSSKEAVSDNFWAWQAVNLVFAGLEAKGIRDAIKEYRTGKAIASLSVFADEGAASRALEKSEAMGANHWTGEDTYRYLKNLEATKGAEYAGLADEYLGGVRSALSSTYGAGVNVLHDSEDVLTLERFETRVRELEKTDPIAARDLRAKAADYLNSGSCGL